MKTCNVCGESKPLDRFNLHGGGSQGRRPQCADCRKATRNPPSAEAAARRKAKRDERYAYMDRVKLESGCADCGYRDHAVALDFDHAFGQKEFGISYLAKSALGWDIVEAELAKCEVVCANCHRVRTKARSDWTPRAR